MKSNGSMNRIYRLVWNVTLQCWVAVAETARGRGKQASAAVGSAVSAAALSVAAGGALLLGGAAAMAAPVGGQVVAGTASVSQTGAVGQTTTTVQQSSTHLALNWQSFNIGAAESVNFVQPSASAIAVNRIADTQGTQILGRLSANGQVWLINPNGLLFGRDAQVNVGGLVASTLDLVTDGFGSSSQRFAGNSTAGVTNLGTLSTADGGSVALLGHSVVNQGLISARLGTVALGAGSAVTLSFSANKLLGMQVDGNALNTLVDNGGVLRADGGQVLMSAGARDSLLASVVNNTGVVEARTVDQQQGRIVLLGGMASGQLNLAGTLDASAPDFGNGGFIETSAAKVHIADSARVTTLASNGQTGRWLIDPTDYTVAASGGDMTGTALSAALALNNVELSSDAGTKQGAGDININDSVSWSTNRNLTLTASNTVNVNASITATGSGSFVGLWINTGTESFNMGAGASINLPNVLPASTNALQINGTIYKVLNKLGTVNDSAATTLQGLKNDAVNGTGGAYALGSDIDASPTSGWNAGAGFTPIGDYANDLPFTGLFNGLGHKISNLTINRPTTDYVGLFGYTYGADIRNVNLVGASVRGQDNVGALAGYVDTIVERSQASGTVTGRDNVGGLVGWSDGAISNSSSSASVVGASNVGGLAGYNALDAISASQSSGNVTGSGDNVGGLVGQSDSAVIASQSHATVVGVNAVGGLVGNNLGTISNSTASGAVSGTGNVGGLVGFNGPAGAIDTGHASGTVTGKLDSVGGLVGENGGSVVDSDASSSVTGADSVGGLIGKNIGNVTNSFATGTVGGTSSVGGLVGYNYFNATIDASHASGNVSGVDSVGGLVGENWAVVSASQAVGRVDGGSSVGGLVGYNFGSVTASQASGAVNASGVGVTGSLAGGLVGLNDGSISTSQANGPVNGSGNFVGGLAGDNSGSVITSYATGSVTGAGSVGGLVGINYGTISNAYASGVVNGSGDAVGGLVGDNENDLRNSYATGGVSGGASVGGLVGLNARDIATSYATGAVSASGTAGGLVGSNDSTGTVTTSFWHLSGSGQSSSDGGTGLGSSQMQQGTSFAGFDLSNSWVIYEGRTAPLLRSFLTPLAINVDYVGGATKVYDASQAYSGGAVTGYSIPAPDPSLLLGTLSSSLVSANVGSQAVRPGGFYSNSQQGYLISYVGGTSVAVTPAALLIAARSDSKVYDGSTLSSLTPVAIGLQGGDTVSATSQVFASKNAMGTGGSTLTVAGYNLNDGHGGGNYVVNTAGAAGTISKAALSITAVPDSKIYDSTTASTATPIVSGLLGTDKASTLSQVFASKNVLGGGASTLTVAGYSLNDGNNGANYQVGTASAAGTINPATLTLAAVADSKVYDGTTHSSAKPIAIGLLGSDSVDTTSQVFASKSVLGNGASTLIAAANAVNDGNNGGNYTVSTTNASGSISPAPLTVAASGVAKVYDASTSASVTLAGNQFAGDQLTVTNGAAAFSDKNVGSAKTITVTGITVGGADAANYTLQNSSASANAAITPAQLTITAVTDSKTYDNTTSSSAAPSVIGLLGSDTANAMSQVFASKNVLGSGASTITVSGYNLTDGNNGANYLVSTTTATGTVSPAALKLSAVSDSKVYDGTTLSSAIPTVSGLKGSDSISAASQVFASKNVAGNIGVALQVAGYSLNDGNNGGNYQVSMTLATGSISAAPLPVAGVTAANKVYDGSTLASLGGKAVVSALAGDQVSVSGIAAGSFADKNVASNKAVTVSGMSLSGSDAGNYSMVAPAGVSASITPAALQYVATPAVTVVGKTPEGLTGTVNGLVAGDTLANATSGTALWTTLATPASPQGNYPINGSGLQARNYAFSQASTNADALSLQPVSLPPVTDNQTAMLWAILLPQKDVEDSSDANRRREALPGLRSAAQKTPLQIVGVGVNLPAGAFGTAP